MIDIEKKFGYKVMIEKSIIRDRLIANGITGTELYFAIERDYMAAHANDPTYRETSTQLSAKWQENILPVFTKAELERIIEHFANANDPISASIEHKARTMIQSNSN